jgi:hypothetical protein
MSVVGDSALWRARLITVYDLIRLGILRAWPACCATIPSVTTAVSRPPSGKRRAVRQRLEDPITRNLIRRLRLDPTLRSQLHIESQRELIEESLDRDPDPTAYIDIAVLFFVGLNEVYLALECKRLNVVWPSGRRVLADKYVEKEMMRFVTGRYSPEHPLGGMIGYVMDGDVQGAFNSVITQIRESSYQLACHETSPVVLSYPDHFSTTHQRRTTSIELRHQLLSVS